MNVQRIEIFAKMAVVSTQVVRSSADVVLDTNWLDKPWLALVSVLSTKIKIA